MDIDTSLIFQAMKHYESRGYKMITVPMLVDEEASNLTKPDGCEDLYHDDKVYVASAEQSFIQLYNEGELTAGKYMALTPCYRDEPDLDETHFNIFLKLELIEIHQKFAICGYMNILADACDFFAPITGRFHSTEAVTNPGDLYASVDIMAKDIEVGSYGVRTFNDGRFYAYGTGIAEPRLSQAIRKCK